MLSIARTARIGLRTASLKRMSSTAITAEDDVLFQNINNTKIITLNRPQKLNSLNLSMVDKLSPRLTEYSKSELTELIIQKSNGRAFCAGGDVASCVESNIQGNVSNSVQFFQREYSLNYLLATYPTPIVSLLDGIVMGGGVGLSIHTPFRIATEKTRWAMPEMDIGFSPDVGTTFALNKVVSSSLGWYLALTGENVYGWDNYFSGLATHYVPSNRLESLTKALVNINLKHTDSYTVVNNVIEDFTEPLPADYKFKYSPEQLQLIENVFHQGATIESIFQDLTNNASEFALKTLETLEKKSFISLKVALELLQRGAKSDIHEALTNELNAAKQFMTDSDFNEAVSSKLIKKSKDLPAWKHKELKDVPIKEILPFFKTDPSLQLDKHFDVTYTEYPHNFGLPKESEIKSFINKQSDKSQAIQGDVTKKDVINYFTNHPNYKQKAGLVKYLNSVFETKVDVSGDKVYWKL